MTALVRQWLLGVTAAALVLALAEALAPEGGAKKVCRLAGGLALLLAAVGPVTGMLGGGVSLPGGEGWQARVQSARQELEEERDALYLAVIEEQTAAYVMDKAAALGVDCQAEVTYGCDEEGVPCPWEITARGEWTEAAREELSRQLEQELGVPAQRQHYEERVP